MKQEIIDIILHSFQKPEIHPTAEELFLKLKETDEKVDKELFNAELRRLVEEQRVYYVLSTDKKKHYGISKGYHGHFICSSCGKVRDFVIGKEVDKMISSYLKELIRTYGVLGRFNLSTEGICHECVQKYN